MAHCREARPVEQGPEKSVRIYQSWARTPGQDDDGDHDEMADVRVNDSALTTYEKDDQDRPLNAEVKLDELVKHFITPAQNTFHRNHGDLPKEDNGSASADSHWKILFAIDQDVVDGLPSGKSTANDGAQLQTSVTFTYGDLLRSTGVCQGVEHIGTTATLECAGNRREDFNERQQTEGIPWNAGAISTASWQGASLRSLLLRLGVPDPYHHHPSSSLESLDPDEAQMKRDASPWSHDVHLHLLSAQDTSSDKAGDQEAVPSDAAFGVSFPMYVCMHPRRRCTLAVRQNNAILSKAHGFPIRFVAPGYIGARWVKWVSGLRLSRRANESEPMAMDYKRLEPPQSPESFAQWQQSLGDPHSQARKDLLAQSEPIHTLNVGSAIQTPVDDVVLEETQNTVAVAGYAVGQQGSVVDHVEVVALVQLDEKETKSSIRNRAAAMERSLWTKADVRQQRRSEASHEQRTTDTADAQQSEKDVDYSWAWSLWNVDLPLPRLEEGPQQRYAIVARATTASGIEQEQESQWNLRGFALRSWPVVRGVRRTGANA